MARVPCTFRQTDLTRAVKAVAAAGVHIARVEIDRAGKITLVFGEPTADTSSEWDEALNYDKR
jgi:hypothetical protein